MSSVVASLFPPSAVEAGLDRYSLARPESRLPSPLPPPPPTSSLPSARPGLTRSVSSSSSQHSSSTAAFLNQTYLNDRNTVGASASGVVNEQFRTSLPGLASITGLGGNQTATHAMVDGSHLSRPQIPHPLPPVPTPGIAGNTPPVCQNCTTSTTPLWRRDESGSVLCNACGLFLKLHGRPRPISLKTDVIKSRNRVKSANHGGKKKFENGLPASQSVDMSAVAAAAAAAVTPGQTATATPQHQNHRRVSQMAASVTSDRSHSPVSRTNTPGLHHDPNIAPQHMFDGNTASLNDGSSFAAAAAAATGGATGSPSLPPLNLGQPSPGSNLEGSLSYDQLIAANTSLRTRVSELELINMVYSDNENNLRVERDKAIRERDELRQRVEQLEQKLNSNSNSNSNNSADDLGRPSKRAKVSDERQTSAERQQPNDTHDG